MSTLKTNQLTHLGNTGTANVVMDANGALTMADDVTIRDNLTVDNNAILSGTASVASTLTVTGNTTLNGGTNTIGGAVTLSGSNVSITADHIDMGSGNSAYTIKTNGKGTRTVSNLGPSGSGHVDGDIWYTVS